MKTLRWILKITRTNKINAIIWQIHIKWQIYYIFELIRAKGLMENRKQRNLNVRYLNKEGIHYDQSA